FGSDQRPALSIGEIPALRPAFIPNAFWARSGMMEGCRIRYLTSRFAMAPAQKFLVIDDNADSRFLLTKTLMRKFPASLVIECADTGTALVAAENERPAAIVVHRTSEMSGLQLIPLLRQANRKAPIVMVSGIDRTTEAM